MCHSWRVSDAPRTPLDLLQRLATSNVEVAPDLHLVESYTAEGLHKMMWYGEASATDVVIMVGGGMGGFMGPASGLYVKLGHALAERDIGAIGVDYRRPDKLDMCLLDAAAAADWAMREGARRIIIIGHSMGGAVAVQLATALSTHCVAIITYATQSAGTEYSSELTPMPFVMFHGDRDLVLGPENSHLVAQMAGQGEVRVVTGADHNFSGFGDELLDQTLAIVEKALAEPEPTDEDAAVADGADGDEADEAAEDDKTDSKAAEDEADHHSTDGADGDEADEAAEDDKDEDDADEDDADDSDNNSAADELDDADTDDDNNSAADADGDEADEAVDDELDDFDNA